MVSNLASKGNLDKPVLIYNRTESRATELAAKIGGGKVEVVSSPVEGARRADVIFTILSNDTAAQEVYATMLDGIKGETAGKLFVECSTVHPDTAESLGKRVTGAGAEFVASPVFGAPAVADAGMLVFIPAGPAASVERVRPFAEGVMARPGGFVSLADKGWSASLKLKLIGNAFIISTVSNMGEGMALAEKSGVGLEALQQVLGLMFGGVHSAYAARMANGVYWKMEEPLFSADNAIKDANHAQSLAEASGVELRHLATAKEYLQDIKNYAGGSKGDIAGLYGAARMKAGLKYENDA